MISCHECVYGETLQVGTEWTTSFRKSASTAAWGEVVTAAARYGPDDTFESFEFTVSGHRVCTDTARQVYGVPVSTWLALLAMARKGPNAISGKAGTDGFNKEVRVASRMMMVTATTASHTWWRETLDTWDCMPNEMCVKHPPLVWENIYQEWYLPEMSASGLPPLISKSNSAKAPGSWFTARKEALRCLSCKHYGGTGHMIPGSQVEAPKQNLQLRERPNHSNFGECDLCHTNRVGLADSIARREPIAKIREWKTRQVEHITDMRTERNTLEKMRFESLRSRKHVFALHDKCGSHWLHMPMPENMRETKVGTSRWHYRQAVHGNSFPGSGNFLSIVPPMLQTGSNFGLTAFCITMTELIKKGRLDGVEHAEILTDGGPDNESKVTYGVNYMLVREGAFNTLGWDELKSAHSHNEQDRYFSEMKAVFYPKDGKGPGCASPFEFCARLRDGMKGMPGGLEVLWLLANFDWGAWLEGCISKEFKHMKGERSWLFEYDPTHIDLVRVTFKKDPAVLATDTHDERRPYLPVDDAGRYRTDPQGIRFMVRQPDVAKAPPMEPWKSDALPNSKGTPPEATQGQAVLGISSAEPTVKTAKSWGREKVEHDVMKSANESMTNAQQAEWEALFKFHSTYLTADSIPNCPITLPSRDGRSFVLNGAPQPWDEMWRHLRRLPRPHHAPTGANADVIGACATTSISSAGGTVATARPRALPLVNGVTGLNYPSGDHSKALLAERASAAVAIMPSRIATPLELKLYFIALCAPEGEYRVGIGRVTRCIPGGGGGEVEWLARKGWSANAAHAGFRWGANPVFQASLDERRRIQESTEPQTSFLPIPVELTQGSTYDASKRLTDKCQSIKLTKACVNTLHEFCTTKRSELLVTHDSESDESDSDEGDDGDESDDAEVESAEEDSSATSRKRLESRPTPNKNGGRKRTSKGV